MWRNERQSSEILNDIAPIAHCCIVQCRGKSMDNISQKMSFYENVGRPQLARNCHVSEQLWIPKIEVLVLAKRAFINSSASM